MTNCHDPIRQSYCADCGPGDYCRGCGTALFPNPPTGHLAGFCSDRCRHAILLIETETRERTPERGRALERFGARA